MREMLAMCKQETEIEALQTDVKQWFPIELPLNQQTHIELMVISNNISCALRSFPYAWYIIPSSPGHDSRSPSCQGHHQMSGKAIATPCRCEGEACFFSTTATIVSIHPPWLMQGPFFTLTDQEGGCCFLWFRARQQPRYQSNHVIAFTPSMPASSGQAHGSIHVLCWEEEKQSFLH